MYGERFKQALAVEVTCTRLATHASHQAIEALDVDESRVYPAFRRSEQKLGELPPLAIERA